MYRKTVLPSGIRVVTEHIPYVRSVALGFWFGVGARHEDESQSGISHLIEHLMFKGTGKRTARQIAETFDAAGGQLNAYTSKEYTCYYARVLDQHLEMATEVLADMLLNSSFDPADLEKEKGVVLEEIKMYEDSPDEVIHDLFTQALLDGHPLGRNILGTAESVGSLTRDDIKAYTGTYYTPDNLVVAAAGNVTHEQVVEQVTRHFAGLQGKMPSLREVEPEVRPHVVVKPKDTEQVHLCLGGPGLRRNEPEKYALLTLDALLGGGMSSRLFQELREERGLVYSTYSYHVSYQDTGLFTVYAGTSPKSADEVVSLIRAEFAKLAADGVNDAEFSRAKEQLKGSLVLSLESTSSRMSRIAKAELFFEKYETPDELVACIEGVQPDDVHQLAVRLFDPARLTLAVIGPWTPENAQ